MTKEITLQEACDEINRLNRERDALKQQLATAERIIEFKDKIITALETRAEVAEARADAAERRLELAKEDDYQSAIQRTALAESNAQRLRSALEAVEWVAHDAAYSECPWCKNEPVYDGGHKPDCQRQLALSAAMGEGNDETLLERLEAINTELNEYAYGKQDDGFRYPEWEEIGMAFAAIERVIQRLAQEGGGE